MIREPKQADIDKAFQGTQFGPRADTPKGRRAIVAWAVIQLACEYSTGYTIRSICGELDMVTIKNTPRKWAKQWALVELQK